MTMEAMREKKIAVVGVSHRREKFGYKVFKYKESIPRMEKYWGGGFIPAYEDSPSCLIW